MKRKNTVEWRILRSSNSFSLIFLFAILSFISQTFVIFIWHNYNLIPVVIFFLSNNEALALVLWNCVHSVNRCVESEVNVGGSLLLAIRVLVHVVEIDECINGNTITFCNRVLDKWKFARLLTFFCFDALAKLHIKLFIFRTVLVLCHKSLRFNFTWSTVFGDIACSAIVSTGFFFAILINRNANSRRSTNSFCCFNRNTAVDISAMLKNLEIITCTDALAGFERVQNRGRWEVACTVKVTFVGLQASASSFVEKFTLALFHSWGVNDVWVIIWMAYDTTVVTKLMIEEGIVRTLSDTLASCKGILDRGVRIHLCTVSVALCRWEASTWSLVEKTCNRALISIINASYLGVLLCSWVLAFLSGSSRIQSASDSFFDAVITQLML